ncbi:MAG: tail fiber protein [Phycisphaerae bacterium]|jgi:microcystin-dependent protein
MSEPFIGEIRMWGLNFAPRGWAFCNGQLLPISQNTALFSLLGTTYGGDGRTTFGLPNLQGRAPVHPGRGPGLTTRRLGETGGVTTVQLSDAQMPQHTHAMQASGLPGQLNAPGSDRGIARSSGGFAYQTDGSANLESMASQAVLATGGSQAHNNLQPLLCVTFCIALIGIYPTRN